MAFDFWPCAKLPNKLVSGCDQCFQSVAVWCSDSQLFQVKLAEQENKNRQECRSFFPCPTWTRSTSFAGVTHGWAPHRESMTKFRKIRELSVCVILSRWSNTTNSFISLLLLPSLLYHSCSRACVLTHTHSFSAPLSFHGSFLLSLCLSLTHTIPTPTLIFKKDTRDLLRLFVNIPADTNISWKLPNQIQSL